MDRKFKVGDRVRFKTLEKIKEEATTVEETFVNGKLDDFYYEFSSGFSFVKDMEHLCGVEAYIRDIYDDTIKLNKFRPYNRDNDYNWIYTDDMVELVEDKPECEQISFECLDELRDKMYENKLKNEKENIKAGHEAKMIVCDDLIDKMENLKPKQKAIDVQIKCLEKVCSDLEKELDEACKEFEEFKNEGINSIKEAKAAVEELKNTYNKAKEKRDESLK